jgi:hypothetical protein
VNVIWIDEFFNGQYTENKKYHTYELKIESWMFLQDNLIRTIISSNLVWFKKTLISFINFELKSEKYHVICDSKLDTLQL